MPLLDTRTTTGTVRYIAKCGAKGCRSISSALVNVTTTTQTYGLPTGGGFRDMRSHRFEIAEGDWTVKGWDAGRRQVLVPPDPCGHGRMKAQPVKGRTNDGVRCDARCQNARRHDCECSCGGDNHGGGWAA